MPAMTSAFSALRLSGRLMVIQSACPRLSRMTLPLSVMVPTRLSLPVSANICGRIDADCKHDLSCCRGLLHPDLVVVERRAADGRNRLRPGQRINAAAADVGLVR